MNMFKLFKWIYQPTVKHLNFCKVEIISHVGGNEQVAPPSVCGCANESDGCARYMVRRRAVRLSQSAVSGTQSEGRREWVC